MRGLSIPENTAVLSDGIYVRRLVKYGDIPTDSIDCQYTFSQGTIYLNSRIFSEN